MKRLLIIITLIILLIFGIYKFNAKNEINAYNLIQKFENSNKDYAIIQNQLKSSISKSYDLKNTSIRWIRKDKKDDLYRIYTSNLNKYNVTNNMPISNIVFTVYPNGQIKKQEKDLEYLYQQKEIYEIIVD